MAIANLTARRNVRGRLRGDNLAMYGGWSTSAATQFYEGGALAVKTCALQDDGSTASDGVNNGTGVLSRVLSGLVLGHRFAGVCQKTMSIPATAAAFASYDFNVYQVPVQKTGTFRFNYVQSGDGGAAATSALIGKKVWFWSDNQVYEQPKQASTLPYPICAGTVVAVPSTTEVEVDITHAVDQPFRSYWHTLTAPLAFIKQINNSSVALLGTLAAAATANRFVPGRDLWINRTFISPAEVLNTTGVLALNMAVSNSPSSFTAGTAAPTTNPTIANTDALGVVKMGYAGLRVLPTDNLSVYLSSTSNLTGFTAGHYTIGFEVLNLN